MTPQEAHRKIADVMDMCKGTKAIWQTCIRHKDTKKLSVNTSDFGFTWLVCNVAEAAIAIVEDRPVFIGDELYLGTYNKTVKIVAKHDAYEGLIYSNLKSFGNAGIENFSWLPPEPKTVMVELTVDTAKALIKFDESIHMTCMGVGVDSVATAIAIALAKLER